MSEKKISNKLRNGIWRVLKIGAMALLILCLILFIIIWGINAYLESNEKKIIEQVEFLNNGSISFEEARVSIINDFPYASIVLNAVEIRDSSHSHSNRPVIRADKVSANLIIKDWRDRSLAINHVTVTRGNIQIIKDKLGYSNLRSLLPDSKSTENADGQKKEITLNTSDIKLSLIDTKVLVVDSLKTMYIEGIANEVHAQLQLSKETVKASVDMDVGVEELSFKKVNGSYVANSHLTGQFEISLIDELININQFDLYINQDKHLFSAEIPLHKRAPININIKNDKVDLAKTRQLLTAKIQKTLLPYEIKGTFPATADITLHSGKPAKVIVDFSVNGNDVDINNLNFSNVKTAGQYINRSVDSDGKIITDSGFQLSLQGITTNLNSINVASDQVTIKSMPEGNANIEFQAHVTGPSDAISEWYESERFFFEGGQFDLTTRIDSPINSVKDILLQSSADLSLTDVAIIYKPSETTLPVSELKLFKDVGDAKFYLKSSTLIQQHDYRLDGFLKNLSALLADFANESATSNVVFSASTLSWSDFISIFSLTQKVSSTKEVTDKQTKLSMKETLKGINKKFKPSLEILIDTFAYFDIVTLYDLKTGAQFSDQNTLQLMETEFSLDQGSVKINTTLDLRDQFETDFSFELITDNINIEELLPAFDYFNIDLLREQNTYPDDLDLKIDFSGRLNDVTGLVPNSSYGKVEFSSEHLDDLMGSISFTPYEDKDGISSILNLEGNPMLFNDFFNNDKFIFQDTGRFSTTFNYDGYITSFDKLLQESKVDLTIMDGAVHNLDVDVIFPLNNLELTVKQDTATFDLYMYSDYIDRELYLSGELDNLSELLFADTGKKLRTKVTATSPLINLSHAVDIFETTPDTISSQSVNKIDNKIKQLTKDILNRFNPLLTVKLDTFIINKQIVLYDLSTGVDMVDSSLLILKETNFDFFDSHIKLNAEFDISNIEEAPFTAYLETDQLELEKVLHAFNYFGSSTMRNANRLTGKLTMNLDLKSSITGIELIENKTKAIIDIELEELQLEGLDVIDRIAKKIFSRQLLKHIKFAPLSNTITITGSQIEIPQMEIQSTGIDLFVEGYVDNKNETNVWLSIPLDNMTRSPTEDIPSKRGYAATKRKVYLEVTSQDEGGIKSKFRLRKKKFYKQRGIVDQFREDKKRYKIIRENKKKGN